MIKNLIQNIFGKKEVPAKSIDLVRAEQIANDLSQYVSMNQGEFVFNHELIKDNYNHFNELRDGLDYRIANLNRNLETPMKLLKLQTELIKYN